MIAAMLYRVKLQLLLFQTLSNCANIANAIHNKQGKIMTPENRVRRLEQLIKRLKGGSTRTYKEIEQRYGVNASYLSQLLNGRRTFGESAARKMEQQFQLPPFYFEEVGEGENGIADILEAGKTVITDEKELVNVAIYSEFISGEGANFEFVGANGEQAMPRQFFEDRGLNPADFRLVIANSSDMSPYINKGDQIGINLKSVEIKDGGFYALLLGGAAMIKQVFVEPAGALRLHSFNSSHPDRLVSADNMDSLVIVGEQIYRAG